MLLEFDRGTVTLSGCSEPEVAGLPGVLWDPRVRVYRAPGHRYSDIRKALNRSGRPFDDQVRSVDGPRPGRWRAVDLRPYQAAALSSWELSGARGLIILPTGSGKTLLALAAMARRRCRALCLTPTRVLLEQWRSALGRYYAGPIGQYGDGVRAREAVTLATFASAFHHMETIGNRFDLLVVDEAHHYGTGASDETLELCTASARIGLTGTPPTSHLQRTRLEELIGPEVYRQSVSELTGRYLAPLRVVTLVLDLTCDERREYAVIGDPVNTASRIEALTKEQGVSILVSQATRERAGEGFTWRDVAPVQVKGKSEPVATFVPVTASEETKTRVARGVVGALRV